jgi:G3E family GTPase
LIADLNSSDGGGERQFDSAGARRGRFVLIGGFLGAGKTTASVRLGELLKKRGLRVGFITNDQGKELVDTASLRGLGFVTEEVPGGSFAARFDSFAEVANRLWLGSDLDVLVAEPVGNSADLRATVAYPLRNVARHLCLAPVSVMVDAVRAARVFGVEAGGGFSDKVAYIFRKQLEEADFIVLNKCDLMSQASILKLKELLENHFREATVFPVSARNGTGLEEWFERVMASEHTARPATEMDYEIYGEGKALLGWLNCTIGLSSVKYFDAGKVLREIATYIQSLLRQDGAEIAHLKMTLKSKHEPQEMAVLSLVRNDHVPELSQDVSEPMNSGEMLLNLRAESSPDKLHDAVNQALLAMMENSVDLFARMEHCEHFRPARPRPPRP